MNKEGTGDRFSFTVDASTNASTLHLITGAQGADVTITASLAGTTDQIDTFVVNNNNSNAAYYKIDFTADTPSDLLTITLDKTAVYTNRNNNRIYISGMGLTTIPEPSSLMRIGLAGLAFFAYCRRR